MNNIRFTAVLVLSLSLILSCAGEKKQDESDRLIEKEGGFSYVPPRGWEIVEFPGLKYRISRGTIVSEFAPNINVVDEQYSGTLDSYVDGNIDAMSGVFEDFNLINREPFSTDEGLQSVMLIVENVQMQRNLRQYFYFFEDNDRKYVVTCTSLASNYEEVDSLFDKSIRSFRLE
jgi:hypothetical protein